MYGRFGMGATVEGVDCRSAEWWSTVCNGMVSTCDENCIPYISIGNMAFHVKVILHATIHFEQYNNHMNFHGKYEPTSSHLVAHIAVTLACSQGRTSAWPCHRGHSPSPAPCLQVVGTCTGWLELPRTCLGGWQTAQISCWLYPHYCHLTCCSSHPVRIKDKH